MIRRQIAAVDRRCTALGFVILFVVATPRILSGESLVDDPASVLKSYGIEPDAAHVLDFLQQSLPTEERLARIQSLVIQLGSEHYADREEASRQLRRDGEVAVAALQSAARSEDLEVRIRAEKLLAEWETAGRGKQGSLLHAALAWLQRSHEPHATPLLLKLIATRPEANLHASLCQTLWACASPDDAERLAQAIEQGNADVKTAAIPALELVLGESAVPKLRGYLNDKDDRIRLATARALIDRSPKGAVNALVQALSSADPSLRAQAAWLLQQASNIPPDQESLDFNVASERWRAWAATAERLKPLGEKRLQFTWYGLLLRELFAENAASITGRYHQFHYEATVTAKAEVAHGILRLESSPQEADQRLYVAAEELFGQPTFPKRFRLTARLGGEAKDAGAWHVGISVGEAKFLFHPGFAGGAFRIETVNGHRYLTESASMPFEPAADILHEMTIDVAGRDDGSVLFEAVVHDGGKSGLQFISRITLKKEDVGEIRRIGLERSGRAGGAALFGSLTIQNLPSTGK